MSDDGATLARAILDEGRYMTLATADADGRPWATPVWYAPDGARDLLWVSRPGARHSRNVEVRPEVGIVIFDSHATPLSGRGVYLSATACQVPDAELERAIAIFSARSQAQAMGPWTITDVTEPSELRLYRATATEQFYGEHDQRTPIELTS